MIKYSVLTYIFGNNYEKMHEIKVKNTEIEYILVTDNKKLVSDTWTIIYDKLLNGLSTWDKCCYVRYHPFLYVHTNYVLKIDGSIGIKSDIITIFKTFEQGNYDLMLMINPKYNKLIDDYQYWIDNRNYSPISALKCKNKMLELGLDINYKGYYQICLMLEKNIDIINEIDIRTYKLLKELGGNNSIERLDQPIYSFILNTYYDKKLKILPTYEKIVTNSKYFTWYVHNSNKKIVYNPNPIQPYLFNKSLLKRRI